MLSCSGISECSYVFLNHASNQCIQLGFRAWQGPEVNAESYTSLFFKCALVTKAASLFPFYFSNEVKEERPHPISGMNYPGLIGTVGAFTAHFFYAAHPIVTPLTVIASTVATFATDVLDYNFITKPPSTFWCPNTFKKENITQKDHSNEEEMSTGQIIGMVFAGLSQSAEFLLASIAAHIDYFDPAFPCLSDAISPLNNIESDHQEEFRFALSAAALTVFNAFLAVTNDRLLNLHQGFHERALGYAPYVRSAIVCWLANRLTKLGFLGNFSRHCFDQKSPLWLIIFSVFALDFYFSSHKCFSIDLTA